MGHFCEKKERKEITNTGPGTQQVLSKCLVALNYRWQDEMMIILLLWLLSLFARLLWWLLLRKSSASIKRGSLDCFWWKLSERLALALICPSPTPLLAFFHGNRRKPSERNTHRRTQMLDSQNGGMHLPRSYNLMPGANMWLYSSPASPPLGWTLLSQQKLIFRLWEILHSSLLSELGKIQVQILAHRFWQVAQRFMSVEYFPPTNIYWAPITFQAWGYSWGI